MSAPTSTPRSRSATSIVTARRATVLLLLQTLLLPGLQAADWTQWRGPDGQNRIPDGQTVPTTWSSSKNVAWKVTVPGRGHASPTVVGDVICLASADENRQVQAVLAFDRSTGKELWLTPCSSGGFPKIHQKNTHASSTTASDGKLIFAVFNHHGIVEAFALDLTGKIVWKKEVGPFVPWQYEYGYAASPTIYNGTVIISGDCDTSAWVKALDCATGRVVWEQARPRKLNWSSPIVADVAGKKQLLLSGCEQMAAYDPNNGHQLWSVPCLTMATCGTTVWNNDTVFASGGYPKAETVAVRADGSGAILWQNNTKCYEQSMLYHDGHIYALADSGVFFCWDARTGATRWQTRMGRPVSASPLLVGDTIFATSESGRTWVFKASPNGYEEIAQNQLGTESFASFTVADNRLLIRVADGSGGGRRETLYAIGNE